MAIAHLISGLPCSGKTTYTNGLRADLNAVAFSLDRWLITSFGKYSIAEVGHEEHVRRVLANRELIWGTASEFLRRGVDVILDDGFFLRENRMRVVNEARRVGAAAKIHFIDTPLDVIRPRLDARNAQLPRYNFWIGQDTLEAFAALFQVPTDDEGAKVVVVRDFARPASVD
jgi:predicted kinase